MKIAAISVEPGFNGALLTQELLAKGYCEHSLTRKKSQSINHPNLKYFIKNLATNQLIYDFLESVTVLYHCATEIKVEVNMKTVNAIGIKILINIATKKTKHWFELSSVRIYGPIYIGKVTENQDYSPIKEYEKTKLQSDLLMLKVAISNLFTTTIVKPIKVFGEIMENQSLFELFKKIDQGLLFFIEKKRSICKLYTCRKCNSCTLFSCKTSEFKNKIYNISNWVNIENFVLFISKNLNKTVPIVRIPLRLI